MTAHTAQTVVVLLLLLLVLHPLLLQCPLLLIQVGLQICDAFTKTILVQQAVCVLQLEAVSTPQSLGRGLDSGETSWTANRCEA